MMIDLNQTCYAKSPIVNFRKNELLRVSKLNGHVRQNLPLPLVCPPGQRPYGPAAKEGYFPSLWKREVRRDFIKQCHYYETVNKSCALISRQLFLAASDFTPLEIMPRCCPPGQKPLWGGAWAGGCNGVRF